MKSVSWDRSCRKNFLPQLVGFTTLNATSFNTLYLSLSIVFWNLSAFSKKDPEDGWIGAFK